MWRTRLRTGSSLSSGNQLDGVPFAVLRWAPIFFEETSGWRCRVSFQQMSGFLASHCQASLGRCGSTWRVVRSLRKANPRDVRLGNGDTPCPGPHDLGVTLLESIIATWMEWPRKHDHCPLQAGGVHFHEYIKEFGKPNQVQLLLRRKLSLPDRSARKRSTPCCC